MARVTVEDCVLRVPNRFDLVMLAAQRARDISSGIPINVDRDNDKNPVVALREIADEKVNLDILRNALIRGMQKTVEADEPEDEVIEFIQSEQDLARDQVVNDAMEAGDFDEGEAEESLPVDDSSDEI